MWRDFSMAQIRSHHRDHRVTEKSGQSPLWLCDSCGAMSQDFRLKTPRANLNSEIDKSAIPLLSFKCGRALLEEGRRAFGLVLGRAANAEQRRLEIKSFHQGQVQAVI